ncbi:GNAT family N-acetyltransferase [Microbacterium rhizophilus]|uniref:GNAT family N-acetyltransferase n=1 Tax=Microbacterium rhizophilus TaxID=3138934 RepID=UPI0031EA242B
MTVEIVALADAVQGVDGWDELTRSAVEPNAFLDPRFLRTCVDHWPEAREVRLALAREESGALVAVHAFTHAPVELRGLSPMAAATTGPLMDAVMPIRRPLLAAGDPERAARLLLHGLAQRRLPAFAAMVDAPRTGAAADALRRAATDLRMPRHTLSEYASPGVTRLPALPPVEQDTTPIDLVARTPHLASTTGRKLRQRYRGLEKELGAPLEIVRRDADPRAVSEFLDLEAAGWKGDSARSGHAYRVIGKEAWLQDLARAFSTTGDLSIVELRGGGVTVAIAMAVMSGGWAFALRDTYDERFARFSPGLLNRLVALHCALTRPGVDAFDPCMGRARDALQLYPDITPHETYVLASRGLVEKTALRAYSRLSRAARTRRVQAGSGR